MGAYRMSSGNHHDREAAEHNRRRSSRYPVNLELEFRLFDGNGICKTGKGRILNLSEEGVCFRSDEALPSGLNIELCIPWPFSTLAAVRLQISGQTIRNDRDCCAVKIVRDRFECLSA